MRRIVVAAANTHLSPIRLVSAVSRCDSFAGVSRQALSPSSAQWRLQSERCGTLRAIQRAFAEGFFSLGATVSGILVGMLRNTGFGGFSCAAVDVLVEYLCRSVKRADALYTSLFVVDSTDIGEYQRRQRETGACFQW